MFKDSLSTLNLMVVTFLNDVFNGDETASKKHILFHTVLCHITGLAHIIFILSPQTQTPLIVIFVFCYFRKLDKDSLLFVDQASAFFSLKP